MRMRVGPGSIRGHWAVWIAVVAFGVGWFPFWAAQATRNGDVAVWSTVSCAAALGFIGGPGKTWRLAGLLVAGFMVGAMLTVAMGTARYMPVCAPGVSCVVQHLALAALSGGIVGFLLGCYPLAAGSFLSGVLARYRAGELTALQASARWIAIAVVVLAMIGWRFPIGLLLWVAVPLVVWGADRLNRPSPAI